MYRDIALCGSKVSSVIPTRSKFDRFAEVDREDSVLAFGRARTWSREGKVTAGGRSGGEKRIGEGMEAGGITRARVGRGSASAR